MKFIKGDNFKNICDYVFDQKGFIKNKKINNYITKFFVKSEYIKNFFQQILSKKFILITHNSDMSINEKYKNYLDNKNLEVWYSQNVDYEHKKLIPIPIGIANSIWPHGNTRTLKSIIKQNNEKQQLIYANFNVNTNIKTRINCLKYIDKKYVQNNVSFEKYLTNLSKSYFSICPLGNGIDSHRIWESLYLKTVPIVENTYNIHFMIKKYKLPIITVNDWSELPNLELNSEVYHKKIDNFNPNILKVENFTSQIKSEN